MPVDPINKAILENQKHLISLQKENKELKKALKNIERKLNMVFDKIQDFEVVFDAAEIIEDEIERQSEYNTEYNTEWNPYDDEDFQVEDYEDYDDDEDDDVIRGY